MVYNFIKKTGLTTSLLMFLIAIVMLFIYMIKGFVESLIYWIEIIQTINENISLYIIILTILLLFTIGVILYIIGEIYEFLFGRYSSILLEKPEYCLTEEDIEKISVIIPAYNEEDTIKKAIEAVKPYCKNVIVVNDGSKDKTGEIAKMNDAIVVEHKLNMGLGQSLKDGIIHSLSINSEIIVNFDADLQYKAEDIPDLVYYVIHEKYDLIMGSRFAGTIEKMSLFKKIGNRLYSRLLRYLTKVGISDGQTGFRAFTKDFAEKIKIRGDFTYTQEMILEATIKKTKIGEIPIFFAKRKDGESRLMKNPFHFAKSSSIFLIKVLIDLNPLKIFAILSSILIVIGFYFGGSEILDWLIAGNIENPFMIIVGIIIIMSGIIILSIALLVSALKMHFK